MSEVNAWLLELGEGLHAAVGQLEMVHVLPDASALFDIPRSPAYCRQVLVWQGQILPLMDLSMRLTGRPAATSRPVVAVTAFQRHPAAESRYGALALSAPPARIRVDDSSACGLPEAKPGWRHLAISCFEHAGCGPVPVLDLGSVFARP